MKKIKIMIIAIIICLSIGYASLNISLYIKGDIEVAVNLEDYDIYIGNLYLNKINKYNSISSDLKSIELEIEKGTNSVEIYVANNATEYDEEISISCNEIENISYEYTYENIVYAQQINKIEISVSNTNENNKTITCNISNEEKERTTSVNKVKKVFFSSEGYENEEAYKIITEETYGEMPTIEKIGYTFNGWYDLNEIKKEEKTLIEDNNDEILYSKFEANTYTIYLNDGYSENIGEIKVTYDETYENLPDPTRNTNYEFLGWYDTNDNLITKESIYKIAGNSTLLAKWNYLCTANEGETYLFDYTGGEQTFTSTCEGEYKLETWGAEGGKTYSTYIGGYGGYSMGKVILNKGKKIYLYIGQQGIKNPTNTNSSRTYNGGGGSGKSGASGGGATHISIFNGGELINYKNNIDLLLIVAGGGGGVDGIKTSENGSSGGGYIGVDGMNTGNTIEGGKGGSQVEGGLTSSTNGVENGDFGYGGNNILDDTIDTGSGGGGGYYGGGSSQSSNGGAGGGSGYIGNSLLTNKAMYCYNCTESSEELTKTISTTCVSETPTENCAKQGNGYVRITLISLSK